MVAFHFSISLTVRASDLNYGNHVGYQNFFSYFQEARIAYLGRFGFSEMDIGGCGMIVAEAHCKYRRELLLNDAITVGCAVSDLKAKLFVMDYQVLKNDIVCAQGHTCNLGYDHTAKSISRLPERFVRKISAFEKRF